uniref:Uncharacterized protein n=1 Tax=Arundo donax TaxID=35708 RepID=A0A0A9G0C0_ARUDO
MMKKNMNNCQHLHQACLNFLLVLYILCSLKLQQLA